MAESLTFHKLYRYDLTQPGITAPVLLRCGDKLAEFKAKVDTGATACIFSRI